MALILGIDTGGTYTDGVVYDTEKKVILHKSKALTTKEDLAIGISQCLTNLQIEEKEEIALVSLSTTLATNAIVEGRGGNAGLIIIGDPPGGKLPPIVTCRIRGRMNIKGLEQEPVSVDEIDQVLMQMKGSVDAIAVSGYASIRNPSHELIVKERVRTKLAIPVVCAHELTSELGYQQRTITTALNARLISIIRELVVSVKKVMHDKKIQAPLMIVKGDGSLMLDSLAINKPIETILSGPAASIVGSCFLTKEEEAIILDIGGTTSDLAHLHKGNVRIAQSGARVGGWTTHVRAAEVCTFGLGGDSLIRFDGMGHIKVGPQRVVPLSCAGSKYPYLKEELGAYKKPEGFYLHKGESWDCYGLLKMNPDWLSCSMESQIADLLLEGPHSLFYLTIKTGKDPENLGLDSLVENGWLYRISLTPTDILHGEGICTLWDKPTAELAIKICADERGLSSKQLIQEIKQNIREKLTQVLVESIAGFEAVDFNSETDKTARYFINRMTDEKKQEILCMNGKIQKPLIGIGAPAKEWLSFLSPFLSFDLIIPEHYEVANAIGAAVGKVVETAEALIRFDQQKECFVVYGFPVRMEFVSLDQAVEEAGNLLKDQVKSKALTAGARAAEPILKRKDVFYQRTASVETDFIETRLIAIAIGEPMWV